MKAFPDAVGRKRLKDDKTAQMKHEIIIYYLLLYKV
jgi:hypothetical protein